MFPRSYFLTWVTLDKTLKLHYMSRHSLLYHSSAVPHHLRMTLWLLWMAQPNPWLPLQSHVLTLIHPPITTNVSQLIIVDLKWTVSASPLAFLYLFNKYFGGIYCVSDTEPRANNKWWARQHDPRPHAIYGRVGITKKQNTPPHTNNNNK